MKTKKQNLSKRDKAFNKKLDQARHFAVFGEDNPDCFLLELRVLSSILRYQPIAWDDTAITSPNVNATAKTSPLQVLGKEASECYCL